MKKEYQICKMQFRSGIHIGKRDGWTDETGLVLGADALFSAFINAYALVYGQQATSDFVGKFKSDTPPFVVSSAFPFVAESYYLPKPLNLSFSDKKLKKAKFITLNNLEDLQNQDLLNLSIQESDRLLMQNIKKMSRTRSSVARLGIKEKNKGGLFDYEEIFFSENSGLYFFVDFADVEAEKTFKKLMVLVGEEGFGGDRSSGKGIANKVEFISKEVHIAENNNYFMLMSLFSPKDLAEISDLKDSFYETEIKGGYIYSTETQNISRQNLRMFTEGSVFKSKKTGRIHNVAPENFKSHDVLKNGIAFMLPIMEVQNV